MRYSTFIVLFLSLTAMAEDPDRANSMLPWTRTVSARESATSESTARYQTQSSLRWEIDRQQSNCRSDRGMFSYSGGFLYCRQAFGKYECSADATCYCRKSRD